MCRLVKRAFISQLKNNDHDIDTFLRSFLGLSNVLERGSEQTSGRFAHNLFPTTFCTCYVQD